MKPQTRMALLKAYFLRSEVETALPDILTTLEAIRRRGVKCTLTAAGFCMEIIIANRIE